MNFKPYTEEQINGTIQIREKQIDSLNNTLKELKLKETYINELLEDINFSTKPDFVNTYKSLYSYIGIFTSELLDAKNELNSRISQKESEKYT